MASDAQTIQVQQQTMSSQQEIIRAQAQMILKLRHILEEQDRKVEELEDAAMGLRSRRPGIDIAPRSRSS
jgi:predicted RNase H-like nuclease (RuvC/YqgF family)